MMPVFCVGSFKKYFATAVASMFSMVLFAQIPNNGIDVQHYTFNIFLNDSNNIIHGEAEITTKFTKPVDEIVFDLVGRNAEGKGMTVTFVKKNGAAVDFSQEGQHLTIHDKAKTGEEKIYNISYEGIPEDGLIIGNNKFGERVFFSAITGQNVLTTGFPAMIIFLIKQLLILLLPLPIITRLFLTEGKLKKPILPVI